MKRIRIAILMILMSSPILAAQDRAINIDSLPDYFISKPAVDTDRLDLFLSARLGSGVSSFSWKEGPVTGKFSLSLDAVAQIYTNEKISFLPKQYYAECSLGYTTKGAKGLPLHYIDLNVLPIGYYHDFKQYRLVGKAGLYTGIPLSTLKYTLESKVDLGFTCGAAVEYRLLSVGLTYEHGLVKAAKSPIDLSNWRLVLQLTCKIFSLNR